MVKRQYDDMKHNIEWLRKVVRPYPPLRGKELSEEGRTLKKIL